MHEHWYVYAKNYSFKSYIVSYRKHIYMCSQEIPNEAKGHNFVAAILEEQDSEVKTLKQPSILNQLFIFLLIIYSGLCFLS